MINLLNVSIWPIIISLVLNMGLGMLWYGPLFGKKWMDGMGYKEEDKEEMQKKSGPAYAVSSIFAVIFGYAIELIINATGVTSIFGALVVGLVVYAGLVLPNTIKGILWQETKKSVFIINSSFEVLFFVIMSVVAFYL